MIEAFTFLSKKIELERERQNLLKSVNLPVNSSVDSRGQKIIEVSGASLIQMPIQQNPAQMAVQSVPPQPLALLPSEFFIRT